MDLSKLTNNQLYGLIQNAALDKDLRSLANIEFDRRKLSLDQMKEIMLRQDARFKDDKNAPLKIRYRFLLVLFPFFMPVQWIFASGFLANGQARKWKNYWFYIGIGFLFWTIVLLLFSKYFLFYKSEPQ